MDDLISRQDAIYALQKEINKGIPPFDDVMGSIRCGVRLARNIIEDLPSAEPEIIRCKDCKHWQDQEEGVVESAICVREKPMVMEIGQYGYCSYGERKER